MLGPEQPRYTGRVAYRTTFPAALMGSERITPVRTKWWGPDRHMVVYYVTANQDEVYFVTSQPEDAGWVTPESWSAKGDLNVLREAYAGFHPEVQAVLRACPEVHKWALLARDPLPRWVESNVALLGDAVHGAGCGLRARRCGRAQPLPQGRRRRRHQRRAAPLRSHAQTARHPDTGQLKQEHLDARSHRSDLGLRLRRVEHAAP
jgi:hypothetical protein